MKLLKTEKYGRKPLGKELLQQGTLNESVLFEPSQVLKEDDFERMVVGTEQTHLAANLAIASLFFPRLVTEQTQELNKISNAIKKGQSYNEVARTLGSMIFSVGMLKDYLAKDLVDAWKARMLQQLERGDLEDGPIQSQLRALVGTKLLFPGSETLVPLIEKKRPVFEHLVTTPIDLENPSSHNLELLGYGLLLFPELRQRVHLPQRLFERISRTMDHSRVHVDPFQLQDVDSFNIVMFFSTVLGNPNVHIDRDGALMFKPEALAHQSTELPERPQV